MGIPEVNQIQRDAHFTAVQRLRQGKLIRYAYCPTHDEKSSLYQGVDGKGWLFRCKEKPDHMSHLFYATPPKNVPKSADEVAAWEARERASEVAEMEKRQ